MTPPVTPEERGLPRQPGGVRAPTRNPAATAAATSAAAAATRAAGSKVHTAVGDERAAALRLGSVYRQLMIAGAPPRHVWAAPPEHGRGVFDAAFAVALAVVYGTDTERERLYGRPNYRSRFDLYWADYRLVVPRLLPPVFDFFGLALNAQRNALGGFLNRLTNQPGLADWLHLAGTELVSAFAREMRKLEAARAGAPPPDESKPPQPQRGAGVSYLTEQDLRDIVTNVLPRYARYAADPTVEILLAHPDAMKIMGSYADSAAKGTLAATSRVRDAIAATEALYADGLPLRYPAFVVGGVGLRGLHDVDGFPEYAVAVFQEMADSVRGSKDRSLSAAEAGLFVLGIVFAAPVFPAVLAAGVLGSQLVLTGFQAGVAFVREHEQELAYRAGAFRPQGAKYARPTQYAGTLVAVTGGAALLGHAVAHFEAARELQLLLDAGKKTAAPPPTQQSLPLRLQRSTQRPPAASGELPALDDEAMELMLQRPQELARLQRQHPFAGHGDATANKLTKDRATGIVAGKGAEYGDVDAVAHQRSTDPAASSVAGRPSRPKQTGAAPSEPAGEGPSAKGSKPPPEAPPTPPPGTPVPKFRIFNVPYGQDPLSRFAQHMRRLLHLTRGGNIAVFQFEEALPEGFVDWIERQGLPGSRGAMPIDPLTLPEGAAYRSKVLVQGNMIAFENTASGGAHSEQFARTLIQEGRNLGYNLKVARIYSELSPCARRPPYCLRTLENSFPSAEVTWSFPYDWDVDWPARNAAIDALFAGM